MALTPAQAVDVINEDLLLIQSITGRLQRDWRVKRFKVLRDAKTIPPVDESPSTSAEIELERLRPHFNQAVRLIAVDDDTYINRAGKKTFDTFMKGEIVPVITTQPLTQAKLEGTTLTLTVVAKGNNLSYQWKKAGTNIGGATSATYTKAGVVVADAASYTVVVTNSKGTVTSSAAVVTVTLIAPTITVQPTTPINIADDATISLSVTATGTSRTYQWKKGGVDIGGATASTYTKANAHSADNGSYTVVVTNSGGSVTSTASVVTVAAP